MMTARATLLADHRLLQVRLDAVCASLGPMFVMNTVSTGLMASAFWTPSTAAWLIGWLCANALLLLARIGISWGFRTRRLAHWPARIWPRLLVLSTMAIGFSWGLPLAWMISVGDPDQIMLVVCVSFGGMAMAMSNVTYWPIYNAFQLPVTICGAIGFALSDRPGHLAFAIGAVPIGLSMLVVSRRMGGQVLQAYRLVDANQALVESLGERGRELEQACRALEQVSRTDALTGLANRRSRDDRLAAEWSRAMRSASPLAVIAIDVDHFKRYNDTHGHADGDRCLQAVAELLQGCTRGPIDMAARHGGEEFMLILPGISLSTATSIAERVRARVALGSADPAFALPEAVTVSLGVAVTEPTADRSPHELTSAADAALYRAKIGGRNRYEVAADDSGASAREFVTAA